MCIRDSIWPIDTYISTTRNTTDTQSLSLIHIYAILPNHSTAAGKSYAFTLEAGTAYQVKLEATGNAPSGGYCKVVESGTDPLYTVPLLPGKSLTFTLIPEQTAVYTLSLIHI